jgi:hypothetical protein
MASVALALFNARPEMSRQARSRPVGWPTRALAPPAFEAGHSAKDTSLLSMSVSDFWRGRPSRLALCRALLPGWVAKW